MALSMLTEFLDQNGVHYEVIPHLPAYTAQGIAGLTHISGKEVAKTVMTKLDGRLAMAVLPADQRVDLQLLKRGTAVESASLASEDDFYEQFPECETGAMPPFGNLYGMPVFADATLALDKEIVFNAGTHRELIRMKWDDYRRLVEPSVLRFAARHVVQAA